MLIPIDPSTLGDATKIFVWEPVFKEAHHQFVQYLNKLFCDHNLYTVLESLWVEMLMDQSKSIG